MLAEVRYPGGEVIYHNYDARGAQTQALKTGIPDQAWECDAAGRAIHSRQGDANLYYHYDEAGLRTALALELDEVTYWTHYEQEERGLLSALCDPWEQATYYAYDPRGLQLTRRLPNQVTSYYNYDDAGQVQSLLHAGTGGLLQSLYYSYDDDGRRTKILREDGTGIYYRYDAAGRLTGEDWLDGSGQGLYAFDYRFDAAGNRTQLTKNGETTYYEYNTLNQLTLERSTAGAQTYYQWQADGAMASQQDVEGWTYFTWDVDEALTRIQAPGVTLDNKYNAHMQRVWRSENGIAETLIYDDQKLIAELTTGGLSRYHLSEGGSAYSLLVSQLGSQCWQLFDALGTVIGLTAGDGSLSDTFLYEAFGTSLGRTGTTETPYQYVGGYGYFHEPTVGLEQVWWRWCLAAITRFISVDPLLMNGPGAYTYCENDPVLGTDAAGLWDCRPCAVDWPKGRDTRNLIKQCLKECQKGWRACAKCIAKYGKGKATGLACDYLACCMQGKPRDPHAGPCTDAEVDCQDCVEFDYQKCLCETGGTLSGLGKCYYKSLTGHLQCHCG